MEFALKAVIVVTREFAIQLSGVVAENLPTPVRVIEVDQARSERGFLGSLVGIEGRQSIGLDGQVIAKVTDALVTGATKYSATHFICRSKGDPLGDQVKQATEVVAHSFELNHIRLPESPARTVRANHLDREVLDAQRQESLQQVLRPHINCCACQDHVQNFLLHLGGLYGLLPTLEQRHVFAKPVGLWLPRGIEAHFIPVPIPTE